METIVVIVNNITACNIEYIVVGMIGANTYKKNICAIYAPYVYRLMKRNAVYNRDFVCTMVIDKAYSKKISDVTYNTIEGFKYVIIVKSIEKMPCDVNSS